VAISLGNIKTRIALTAIGLIVLAGVLIKGLMVIAEQKGYQLSVQSTVAYSAGEALTAQPPKAVYVSQGESDRQAGSVYLLDASNSHRYSFAGFVTETVAPGGSVTIRDSGVITGFRDLKPGTLYYADAENPGAITSSAPLAQTQFQVPVGVAVSISSLEITPALAKIAKKVDLPQATPAPAGSPSTKPTPSISSRAAPYVSILGVRQLNCNNGDVLGCQFVKEVEMRGVRGTLEKRCWAHYDPLDCFEAGKAFLPEEESGERSLSKEMGEACVAGRLEACFIAAGALESLGHEEQGNRFFKIACDKGVWDACILMNQTASKEQKAEVERACSAATPQKCILAGGMNLYDAPEKTRELFDKACNFGEAWGCIYHGYFFSLPVDTVAKIRSACGANQLNECARLGAFEFNKTFDYASSFEHMTRACKGGVQAACDFNKFHEGSWAALNFH
jgi:hypothetical protein